MDVENKNTSIRSGIISADMTKLIAADSFMSALDKPPILSSASMDPDAPQSFEALCTVLTNDTLIYFQKPPHFPKNPRPVMAEWNKIAADMFEKGKVAKPASTEPLPSIERAEKCEIMIDPFNNYISDTGISDKLTRWARFQFSDPEIMAIYWPNSPNGEDELIDALDIILRHHHGKIPTSFQEAFTRFPPIIDRLSSQNLRKREWTPEEFTVAYIFWAFVKGYRYAASLTSENIYAFHWLRERAMNADVNLRPMGEVDLGMLFPWGHFLSELIKYPKFKFDNDSIREAISNLREYTISDLYRFTPNIKKLKEFTWEGIWTKCLPKKLGADDYYKYFKESVDISLALFILLVVSGYASIPIPEILGTAISVKTFDYLIDESAKDKISEKCRRLRLLRHRLTISSLIKKHRKELINFLNEYKKHRNE